MQITSKLKYLNLGCGLRFHPDWTNIDFSSSSEHVISHNLLNGIPFADNSFEVIYHSHVLEHFSKDKAKSFIDECYRALQSGGIIRIAVPDLEQITRLYLEKLEAVQNGEKQAEPDYEWMLLELFDQTVRNHPGGHMGELMSRNDLPNAEFINKRMGKEFSQTQNREGQLEKATLKKKLGKLKRNFQAQMNKVLVKNRYYNYFHIGKFRMGGEIHQWMYDQYSLKKLLSSCSFKDPQVKTASESGIPHWAECNLDLIEGAVNKPDSLFMEAYK